MLYLSTPTFIFSICKLRHMLGLDYPIPFLCSCHDYVTLCTWRIRLADCGTPNGKWDCECSDEYRYECTDTSVSHISQLHAPRTATTDDAGWRRHQTDRAHYIFRLSVIAELSVARKNTHRQTYIVCEFM